MAMCTVCQIELKITKTNTELKAHAEGKHGKTLEECFPGAGAIAAELAASRGKGGAAAAAPAANKGGKKKGGDIGDLDDLLAAGLNVGKKKGKK